MKRIVILEPDRLFAAKVTQTVAAISSYAVTSAATLREVCLILAQQPQDLALIAVQQDEIEGAIQALRTLQADLRLVLMPSSSDFRVPAAEQGLIQGVLIKSCLEADLRTVLERAFTYPFQPDYLPLKQVNGARESVLAINVADLLAVLKRDRPDGVSQAAIFSYEQQVIAQSGSLNRRQAAAIALLADTTTTKEPGATHVQFLHFPGQAGQLLLYRRTLMGAYQLTLVAGQEGKVNRLRQEADEVSAELLDLVEGEDTRPPRPRPLALETAQRPQARTFAILWRTADPLPPALVAAVRQALAKVAAAHSCDLRYLALKPDFSHIVVSCPAGRGSGWAAHLFKSGVQLAIQEQFGVTASLWQKGHFALESTEPLSTAELELFLTG